MAKFESWFQKAAERMVRQGVSLPAAVCDLEIPDITSSEARAIESNPKFQKVLWAERHRFYAEIANDPARTKNAAIGQLVLIVEKLMGEGKLKDASEAILKLAKVQGWVGEAATVNVFGNLSDKELRDLEKSLAKGEKPDQLQ